MNARIVEEGRGKKKKDDALNKQLAYAVWTSCKEKRVEESRGLSLTQIHRHPIKSRRTDAAIAHLPHPPLTTSAFQPSTVPSNSARRFDGDMPTRGFPSSCLSLSFLCTAAANMVLTGVETPCFLPSSLTYPFKSSISVSLPATISSCIDERAFLSTRSIFEATTEKMGVGSRSTIAIARGGRGTIERSRGSTSSPAASNTLIASAIAIAVTCLYPPSQSCSRSGQRARALTALFKLSSSLAICTRCI
mmetsp:Transcript_34632/g.89822  ORF Transcript_34632/g.89822 Transcript_34632/m.89822 type:complete len:248 (-) Transcript_34632:640-1383(-)